MLVTTESAQKDGRHYEKWGSYTAELEGVFRECLVHTLHFRTEEKHGNQRAK